MKENSKNSRDANVTIELKRILKLCDTNVTIERKGTAKVLKILILKVEFEN